MIQIEKEAQFAESHHENETKLIVTKQGNRLRAIFSKIVQRVQKHPS